VSDTVPAEMHAAEESVAGSAPRRRRPWRRGAAAGAVSSAEAESQVRLTQVRVTQRETTDEARRRRELANVKHERKLRRQREKERAKAKAKAKARRRARLAKARNIVPLLLVNAVAVGGQLKFGYDEIADPTFPWWARLMVAVMYAAASEVVAVYVGWHAHTALLESQYRAATNLRRWSYLIAGIIATLNYSHFAGKGASPTAVACTLALFSLLSPWLWGLHSRRVRNIQLIKDNPAAIDSEGVEFSRRRRRAFPIRTWRAGRFALDHGITEPAEAWRRYNASRKSTPVAMQAGAPAGPPRDRRSLSELVILIGALEALAPGMPDGQICSMLQINVGRLAMARSAAKIRTLHAEAVIGTGRAEPTPALAAVPSPADHGGALGTGTRPKALRAGTDAPVPAAVPERRARTAGRTGRAVPASGTGSRWKVSTGTGTTGTSGTGTSGTGTSGTGTSAPGSAKALARKFWEAEVAAGRVPAGRDLARAAGKDNDDSGIYRRYAREWAAELAGTAAGTSGSGGESDAAAS
jgi:hypothetical protein